MTDDHIRAMHEECALGMFHLYNAWLKQNIDRHFRHEIDRTKSVDGWTAGMFIVEHATDDGRCGERPELRAHR